MRRAVILGGGAAALVAIVAVFFAAEAWRSGEEVARIASAQGPTSRDDAASSDSPSPARPQRPPLAGDRTSDHAPLEPPVRARALAGPVESPLDESGESGLMARLRSVRSVDPAAAVALAREGNRRFPDSPDAPERSSILIHALAAQGLASEARGEAEDMVNRYPDSSWVREVEGFTGAHRHRNLRLTEAGTLEYY